MKKRIKLSKEDKIEMIRTVLLAFLGLGLTILFIYLYNNKNFLPLTIVTAVISYAYMSVCMVMSNNKEALFKHPVKWSLLLPLIYTGVMFLILLFIEHKRIPDDPRRILDCFMWAVYTIPSFMIVIAVAMGIILGLAYV